MISKVMRYVTGDGSEFNTEAKALKYERLIKEIKEITADLPKLPKDCSFANGEGYIQHSKSKVEEARAKLFKLARANHKTLLSVPAGEVLNSYYFARVLDDSDSPLYPVYIRLVQCINNDTYREYGQPYFASYPEEATGKCLNP